MKKRQLSKLNEHTSVTCQMIPSRFNSLCHPVTRKGERSIMSTPFLTMTASHWQIPGKDAFVSLHLPYFVEKSHQISLHFLMVSSFQDIGSSMVVCSLPPSRKPLSVPFSPDRASSLPLKEGSWRNESLGIISLLEVVWGRPGRSFSLLPLPPTSRIWNRKLQVLCFLCPQFSSGYFAQQLLKCFLSFFFIRWLWQQRERKITMKIVA